MALIGGFGNPLLDISVRIGDDKELLMKYNLEEDGQKQTDDEGEMKSLLQEVAGREEAQKNPGGCAQNTMRVLQWLMAAPGSTVMFGSIGADPQGVALKRLVENDGVRTCYVPKEGRPTGFSLALIGGQNRSLVAHLGAAEYLTVEDLRAPEIVAVVKEIKVCYMEGFFLTRRSEPALRVLREMKDAGKVFAFNLSAVYMLQGEESGLVARFAEDCDVLFGNRREFGALAKAVAWEGGLETLAEKLVSGRAPGAPLKQGKIVVMTDGSDSVCCRCSDGTVVKIPVPRIERELIKDTTGAGDAFVAGFLAGLLKTEDPEAASKWGCYAARQIIQQIGCRIPDHAPDLAAIRTQ